MIRLSTKNNSYIQKNYADNQKLIESKEYLEEVNKTNQKKKEKYKEEGRENRR